MKKRVLIIPVVLGLGIVCTSPVTAQDRKGGYLGVSAGRTNVKTLDVSGVDPGYCQPYPCNIDAESDTFSAWKVFGGYRFNRYFAVEGGWTNFDEIKDNPGGDIQEIKFDLSGINGFARAILPLGPVDLYGKLGFIWWDGDIRLRTTANPSIKADVSGGTKTAYGLGATFNLGRNFGIRAEWEAFTLDNVDQWDLYTLGVQYRFGG